MKAIIALLLVVSPSIGWAWFVRGNPDASPSIGFNVESTRLSGSTSEVDGPPNLKRIQHGTRRRDTDRVGLDVRVPVNSSLSLEAGYDKVWVDDRFIRGTGVFNRSDNMDGQTFRAGVRFYLNR